jgi:predicted lactoylglutathione lyase
MDFKLEVIVLPVSDVDRALTFYKGLDADFATDPKFRVVQLTPPGSPASVSYGSFASFGDPDGNGWVLQEITTRLSGR